MEQQTIEMNSISEVSSKGIHFLFEAIFRGYFTQHSNK